MPRRRTEKPVERLRSSWNSTADLEETIAAMFHPAEEVGPPPDVGHPPDKLAGSLADGSAAQAYKTGPVAYAPTDNLTSGTAVILPGGPQDILSGGEEAAAPVSLSGPVYETLNGLVVDAKCIRPYEQMQSAHTPSEHQVYQIMWRMLGSRGEESSSREGILAMVVIAQKASLSLRNLRRVLRSLEQKLAIEVTEYEDKTRSIPRRYRVWSLKAVLERRRAAGYWYVYRNRNLVTLARSYSPTAPDKMTGGAQDKLAGGHQSI
jgi:hypothetical protein